MRIDDLAPSDPVAAAVCWSRYATRDPQLDLCLEAGDGPAGAPITTDHVLLARADAFPDALASGAAQGAWGAPLLLTSRDALDQATVDELARLDPQRVTLLGGIAALDETIEADLRDLGYEVDRLAGATRIDTAAAIARAVAPTTADALLVRAFGSDGDETRAFADSLAAGAWAAERRVPVLLSDSTRLSDATAEHLRSSGITRVTIVGGEAAVGPGVAADVAALGLEVERVAGADRAATATAIAEHRGLGAGAAEAVVLLEGYTATAWVDGFAAALSASRTSAAVLLAAGDDLPPATAAHLAPGAEVLVCGPATASAACEAAAAALR